MELVVHILAGALCQILCFMYFLFPFNILFTAIFAFLSHFIVDTLAKMTYHTPEPHKEDKFWVRWHIITPIITLIVVIWAIVIGQFWFFLLGAFFANLVDIWDWMIWRPLHNKRREDGEEKKYDEGYFFHKAIDWLREKPFGWLPNWNYEKKGVIVELITIAVLWLSVILLLPNL